MDTFIASIDSDSVQCAPDVIILSTPRPPVRLFAVLVVMNSTLQMGAVQLRIRDPEDAHKHCIPLHPLFSEALFQRAIFDAATDATSVKAHLLSIRS